MTDALRPRLTRLDERVLEALAAPECVTATQQAARLGAIVAEMNRGKDPWSAARTDAAEVRGILRGLEHLGLARRRGAWWSRTEPTEGNP